MKIDLHITTQPKCFIWIDRVPAINDSLHVELLKYDILLKKEYSANLESLEKRHNDRKAYLFSLDGHVELCEAKTQIDVFAKANDYMMMIANFHRNRSVVYTSYIDKKIEQLFKNAKIPIVMKNLNDEKKAIDLLRKLSQHFFDAEGTRINRGFLRLLLKESAIKADILINETHKVECVLKDISMNGLGFIVSPAEFERFAIKDVVNIKIYIPRFVTRIKAGVVIRMDEKNNEIGCLFSIEDERMIDPSEAKTLSTFIHSQIIELSRDLKFSECD